MGFKENVLDVGPVAFLLNSNWTISDTEIQVFGRPVWHCFTDDMGEMEANVLGLRFRASAQDDDSLWKEVPDQDVPF